MRTLTKRAPPPELEAWLDGDEGWVPDYASL